MRKPDRTPPAPITVEGIRQLAEAARERAQSVLSWADAFEEQLVVTAQELDTARKTIADLQALNSQHCVHITDLRLDAERKDRRLADLQNQCSDLTARIRHINLATNIEPEPVDLQIADQTAKPDRRKSN